jgi:hypothetical protein
VGYIYVSQFSSCSKVCNSSYIYYIQGKCALNCVDGTFLLNDLVTCQKCSVQCAACAISGNNCTKCSSKLWYNYNCVNQCPQNFYANSNNSCISCDINPNACAVSPLNFTFKTFTKNYQLFAYVIFNRPVNLTLTQFNQIVMIQTQAGPIKANSYEASVYNSTTFLISFYNSSSLN